MKVTTTTLIILLFRIFLLFPAQSFGEGFNEEEVEKLQRPQFPNGFFFGAATSSYQIEGAYLEAGKSLSNWDVFTRIQGRITSGENGDVADDHYHRYLEDVEIMDSLGINAYRFSISWARVLPRIEPFVTIRHHDHPQELEDRYGGWLSPLMQEDFVHLAEICFKSFGDRVKYWMTINEPNLFIELAYEQGLYPPARCSAPFGNCSAGNSDVEPLVAMHNMLLAHAKAAKLYREQFQPTQGGSIGIVANMNMFEPLTEDELDREAARRALAFDVAWVFDPLVYGDYPPEMRRYHGSELPRFSLEEKEYTKGSIDFIGINHYATIYAKDCLYSSCSQIADRAIKGFVEGTGERDGIPIGEPTGMPFCYVVPRGMEEIVNYVKERYHNKPMFVTENGE
ncbi:unnamed protein product [Ilex paraguariensis]|uniref:Uncharacterized protein n=1 Tax=Ilex paraguariensis TaxID=185542 RepID=A0ABC8UCV9_9AQUA